MIGGCPRTNPAGHVCSCGSLLSSVAPDAADLEDEG